MLSSEELDDQLGASNTSDEGSSFSTASFKRGDMMRSPLAGSVLARPYPLVGQCRIRATLSFPTHRKLVHTGFLLVESPVPLVLATPTFQQSHCSP
jgi:hypothetical protein